ncbi:MAG: nucleoside triphosphate pyrophosphohydrolase [Leptolyngbyaceae cyanobacterium]
MPSAPDPTLAALQRLIDVVAQLRSPDGGCPWDLAQTPESLMPYVIEEAYEVVDAIRHGDSAEIADELGDLLLQVVLQAQVAQDMNRFTLKEVAEAIATKLIRRHPHVFGETDVADVETVRHNWEAIKAEEEGNPEALTPKLRKYARSLPPLLASGKISQKAAKAGFEWDNVDGVWDKFHEELDEFHHAIQHESKARQQSELGDLLFTLVNIARWYDIDPSEALQSTNTRFINRFAQVEEAIAQHSDRAMPSYSIEELERLWQAAKAKLDQPES